MMSIVLLVLDETVLLFHETALDFNSRQWDRLATNNATDTNLVCTMS
jgi:hypothetical protein